MFQYYLGKLLLVAILWLGTFGPRLFTYYNRNLILVGVLWLCIYGPLPWYSRKHQEYDTSALSRLELGVA